MDESRLKAFRALKPPCVELSQVALQFKGKKVTGQELVKALERVHRVLTQVSEKPNALDPKLAEYAFFPLSHIFRDTKDLPAQAVELALQCLQILIAYGWQDQLSSDLSKQLLILLCILAGGGPTDPKVKDVNEELATAAFDCLASLLGVSKGAFLGTKTIEPENVPILGHSVTVILEGILDGPAVKVRLAALTALDNMLDCITDLEALKNVLPGIVSSLTKVLSLKLASKPSFKVLTMSLHTLSRFLHRTLRDDLAGSTTGNANAVDSIQDKVTDSWTASVAGQIKMALANLLPLRYHERSEVRNGLFEISISIIQQCRKSLAQSVPMLTETLIVICSQSLQTSKSDIFRLESLIAQDPSILDIMKSSLHDWIVGLPRVMQTNDDTRKNRTTEQVSLVYRLLTHQNSNLDLVNDSMAVNLRASVASAIQASTKAIRPVSESSLEVTQLLQLTNAASRSVTFGPVLFGESSNKATMKGLQDMATQLKALSMSTSLQQSVSGSLRSTSGDEQLAGLWLCVQLLRGAPDTVTTMDEYLNLPQDLDAQQPFLDDVYAFSLEILNKSTFEDEDRWKLQSLALEVVALQAQQQGNDFRPELVDALYPILERLGSNNAALQHHAIACLNVVSRACDYPDSASLIVNNADYLVNAVALKLNTFDISPQAPQVLVIMIKLSGSALIPYLDDLVESTFSILACYHGYPLLVASLFSVLNAIVEEAAKAPIHTIEAEIEKTTRPQVYQPTTISDLAALLRSNKEKTARPLSPPSSPPTEPITLSHFQSIKSKTKTKIKPSNSDSDSDSDSPPTTPPRTTTPPPPPPSKTHTIISSIASLTPAHLTTPSPPLRAGILTLLSSALPILATNTDAFLPLAATLFPAITARLYDLEPYTTLAALNALTTLCQHAGDFVAQRVSDEWPRIWKLYAGAEREMREECRLQGRSRARGMKWKVWDAVVRFVIAVVRDVGVDADMEDGVFEMLGGVVGERGDVTEALEGLNADALWLVEEQERGRRGEGGLMRPEGVEGVEFRDVVI